MQREVERKPTSTTLLQVGDIVEVVGLDCLDNGSIRSINETRDGRRYFFCQEGQHFLDEDTEYKVMNEHITITKITFK